MSNTIKIAKWEIKRNLKNKSFIISLFITPILFLAFFLLGNLANSDEDQSVTTVYVNDKLNILPALQEAVQLHNLPFKLQKTGIAEDKIEDLLKNRENTAYLFIGEQSLTDGVVPVYTSDVISPMFANQIQLLAEPLKALQLEQLGLSKNQLAAISKGIVFEQSTVSEISKTEGGGRETEKILERIVPGAFASIILLSIVFSGMMIFQSASQEKKDKIAEIILSSVTPKDLMQGKIIGYFLLGMLQVVVFFIFIIPIVLWKIDVPIFHYLFVPHLFLFIGIALLGYLLFSSIFVGIGATMADIYTAGNFQGLVILLPFLSFVFVGPVLTDPSGLWAQIGTYLPFTSPAVLILRLAILEEWPWAEIVISLAILIISVWIFMKLAGKIFKVGILMYGKNATPKEIWTWIRQ
ncbi:ABC transporter permease [Aeribacillus sp. FSL K6-1305]|uniref:ABC transporter permease n=1 Tax=Aeribacillus sp. FSL K6-1305 TaxID=2954569 RepID=UPI0030FD7919